MPSETANWDVSGTFWTAQHNALAAAIIESVEFATQNIFEIGRAHLVGEQKMRFG